MPSMYRNKNINANGFLRHLFNDTVCMEICVCFTIAKYINGIFSLCETSNVLIHAFFHSKINLHHQSRLFKLIKNAEIFTPFVRLVFIM